MMNLKIGWRLGLAFGGVLVLLLLVLAMSLFGMASISTELDQITHKYAVGLNDAAKVESTLGTESRLLRSMLLFNNAGAMQRMESQLSGAVDEQKAAFKNLDEVVTDPDLQNQLNKVGDHIQRYEQLRKQFLDQVHQGKSQTDLANYLESTVAPAGRTLVGDAGDFRNTMRKRMEADYQQANQSYHQTLEMQIGLGVVAVLLGLLLAWLISRGITRPIEAAVSAARAVADGDLTQDLRSDRKDETGQLLNALADMGRRLREVVANIREGVDTISTAAGEIATGNTDLSQRTEEQASSLEETASSMEEMTSTVRQNAENARQANVLAREASTSADRGGDVMDGVVKHMQTIKGSSKKMSEIISVIDGIAFQTNILALNAAVEAARAGEQGRGFAVVAGEVRSLAQRSASAAKDIKELIEDSVAGIDAGSELVDKAGTSMDEILGSIKKVTDIIGEISAASDEQSTGIEQINEAVTQMDEVTQQNAALVEEAAAASESLQSQAEELDASVGRFRLHRDDEGQRRVQPRSSSSAARPAPAAHRGTSGGAHAKTGASAGKAEPARAKPSAQMASGGEDDWEEF